MCVRQAAEDFRSKTAVCRTADKNLVKTLLRAGFGTKFDGGGQKYNVLDKADSYLYHFIFEAYLRTVRRYAFSFSGGTHPDVSPARNATIYSGLLQTF
jgi:hypothetical protein